MSDNVDKETVIVNELEWCFQLVMQTSSLTAQHRRQLELSDDAYLTDTQLYRPEFSREADALNGLIVSDPKSTDSGNYSDLKDLNLENCFKKEKIHSKTELLLKEKIYCRAEVF